MLKDTSEYRKDGNIMHKIEIRNKAGEKADFTTGANVEISLDGKPLRGVKSVVFAVDAESKRPAIIQLKMMGNIDLDINNTVVKQKK